MTSNRTHVCGDPNDPCDTDCMERAADIENGQIHERQPSVFFINYRGKTYGYFLSQAGAEEFLRLLKEVPE